MREGDDIDVLRQLYATVFGGADLTLTLLEEGNVWEAKQVLRQALLLAEELYIQADTAEDQFSRYRRGEGKCPP